MKRLGLLWLFVSLCWLVGCDPRTQPQPQAQPLPQPQPQTLLGRLDRLAASPVQLPPQLQLQHQHQHQQPTLGADAAGLGHLESSGDRLRFVPAPLTAQAHPGPSRALSIDFGTAASGGLRVALPDQPDLWLSMRPSGAQAERSHARQERGLLIYEDALPDADALYAASPERVEGWLHLRTPRAAANLAFELELGPGLASLRADASGRGLEALDRQGHVQLRTSIPEGVDSQHAHVLGKLIA